MEALPEALRLYRKRSKPNYPDMLDYAGIWRVETVMRPDLESGV